MFKFGDQVRCKSEYSDDYEITNEYCTCSVIEEEDGDGEMLVSVVDHEYDLDAIGEEHYVSAGHFELVSSSGTTTDPSGKPVPMSLDKETADAVALGII